MKWSTLLGNLLAGQSLSADETAWATGQILAGAATEAQIAAFAVALRAKGETVAEVAGLAEGMLAKVTPLPVSPDVVDLVGTGGDQAHTVNISTMAAIVAAAAGVPVVKHGGRAATSTSGAADVLEALGVRLDLDPATSLREAGISFCFAPRYHPGFAHAAKARKELGVPTVFNFLAPLINPARPKAQAVGVAHAHMAPVIAGVLAGRGCSSLVFRGDDGLDELSTCAPSTVWVVRRGGVSVERFDPVDLGIPRATPADLRGGDAAANAAVARAVLAGRAGPVRDIVVLNAAAAVVAHEAEGELTAALGQACKRTADAIDSGAAAALLDRWSALR